MSLAFNDWLADGQLSGSELNPEHVQYHWVVMTCNR
jgi:hypothetical protein